jgi:hypothetical protein
MRRFALGVAAGAIAFGASLGWGCNDSGSDSPDPSIADVLYEGGATDEALTAMLEVPLVDDPTQAAAFTWPSDGAVVPSSPAPTFCWLWSGAAISAPPLVPVDPTVIAKPKPPRSKLASLTDSFLHGWLDGVPKAYAHGTPLSGAAFFLVFSTDSNPKLLRVFTTSHDYTPDAVALKKLTDVGGPIHAVVTTADFDQNRIAQAGGPFKGVPITFTMSL